MKREVLDKWLNGELSPSEMEALKSDATFAEYQKIDSFVKKLEVPEQEHTAGLKELKTRFQPLKKSKLIQLAPFLRVAAAAIFIICVGYFYFNSSSSQVITLASQTEIVSLPDDSKVTMNENSSLKFRKNNWDEHRSLELQGEAFFEVAKGQKFDVNTHNGIISVLGTKFNVRSLEDVFEVVCYEGRVGVTFQNNTWELLPGDKLHMKNGELFSEKKYTSQPSWIYNESSFRDMHIEKVLLELESVYGVNIITENIDVDLRYTGSFTNDNLADALQTITLPLDLIYTIENKNVTISPKE